MSEKPEALWVCTKVTKSLKSAIRVFRTRQAALNWRKAHPSYGYPNRATWGNDIARKD